MDAQKALKIDVDMTTNIAHEESAEDDVDMTTNTHFADEERRTNKQHGGRAESAEDRCQHDNEHCTRRKH